MISKWRRGAKGVCACALAFPVLPRLLGPQWGVVLRLLVGIYTVAFIK
jgi:hypothetical protein